MYDPPVYLPVLPPRKVFSVQRFANALNRTEYEKIRKPLPTSVNVPHTTDLSTLHASEAFILNPRILL